MENLKVFKKYCELTNQQEKFAFVKKDSKNNLFVETLSGKIIKDVAYQKKHLKRNIYSNMVGKLVKISYATCDNTSGCQIGSPKTECVENEIYTPDKCAVVFLRDFSLNDFKYELTHNEFVELKSSVFSEVSKFNEEKQELIDCIHNFMGFFDTPIAKSKMPSDDCEKVREIGRNIMKKYNVDYRGL